MQKSGMKNRAIVRSMTGVVASHAVGEGKVVDLKLGIALLRDRRVPVASKLLALVGGIGLIMLLEALEFPAELWLSLILPVVGFGLSAAVDGFETVAGSFLLTAALLPHLAPKDLVNRIRQERSGAVAVTVPAQISR